MGLKLNGATSGSIEIDVPAVAGTDTAITIPATTGGEFIVSDSSGNIDLGPLDINGGAADDSVNIDGSGRLLVGTSSTRNISNHNAKLQVEDTGYSATFQVVHNSTDAAGAFLFLGKSRGTTVGSNTIVQGGDDLGDIRFYGADGTDLNSQGGSIKCEVDGTPGANDMPGRLVFSTTADGASSPTERMRINSSGELHSSSYTTDGWWLRQGATGSASTPMMRFRASSADTRYHIEFSQGTSTVGSISSTSGGTSYSTSSDYRLKENVVDLDGAIDRVKQLAPKRFNFIANADTTVDGFLAHEAQTVVPEAVTGTHNEVDDDGNPVYQGIDQSKLVPLLTAALQEAIAKIETLETANASQAATIAAFEARLTALEGGAA